MKYWMGVVLIGSTVVLHGCAEVGGAEEQEAHASLTPQGPSHAANTQANIAERAVSYADASAFDYFNVVYLDYSGSTPPYLALRSANSVPLAELNTTAGRVAGFMSTAYVGNGNELAMFSTLSGNASHGYIAVRDALEDSNKAGMYVNSSSQGVIFADVKNFVAPHPSKSHMGIVYASLEGPEAAMYIRGTASLRNGFATVELPEHFRVLAAEQGMTVTLTPHSADSQGLARVSLSLDRGLEVRELHRGRGSYDFDYEIKAVRKGFEDYQVIRPLSEFAPAAAD